MKNSRFSQFFVFLVCVDNFFCKTGMVSRLIIDDATVVEETSNIFLEPEEISLRNETLIALFKSFVIIINPKFTLCRIEKLSNSTS